MTRETSVGNPTALSLPQGIKLRAVVEIEDIHRWRTLYRRPVPIKGKGEEANNCGSDESIMRHPLAPLNWRALSQAWCRTPYAVPVRWTDGAWRSSGTRANEHHSDEPSTSGYSQWSHL